MNESIRTHTDAATAAPGTDGSASPLFAAHNLSKHYGGVAAVRDVSIEFPAGSGHSDRRRQRRRQVDADQDAVRRGPARSRSPRRSAASRFASPRPPPAATPASPPSTRTSPSPTTATSPRTSTSAASWSTRGDRFACSPELRCDAARIEALADLKVHVPNVDREARTLSGGQRQGVAIARAVHQGATILVMDEPMAALGLQEQARVIDARASGSPSVA